MKRFMKFIDIMNDIVNSGLAQEGLIIKCVSTDQELVLKEFTITGELSKSYGFFTEERELLQTIDPNSVWELVNINLEGDIKEEIY